MHHIDLAIFILYMIAMLLVGFYFLRKNESGDDYYVGGRNMTSWHIGLSVVATDVGGGFSIGLGGLGFTMGLSGSWMLFTGMLGAWLAAVFLIPKVKSNSHFAHFHTFPEIFKHYYGAKVALIAGIISAIGYIGFTSSQILAGAKLAGGVFEGLEISTALWIMGIIAVVYTVMGGIKAVIYTDTFQWILLLSGLIFIGIPIAFFAVGGAATPELANLFQPSWLLENGRESWAAINRNLPEGFLSLGAVRPTQFINWMITIIPIWFIGMTLYQRIYACRDEKTAKKAWYIAGFFEWPVMAFMGVILGMLARVALAEGLFDHLIAANESLDPETAMPMLLSTVLPVGLMGLMMSAYFSAVLSTADSCLMAASGNILTDIFGNVKKIDPNHKKTFRWSQVLTLIVGAIALMIAYAITEVLELMLLSYAFMVSGLLVPLIGALFFKQRDAYAAGAAMIGGGSLTVLLSYFSVHFSRADSQSVLLEKATRIQALYPEVKKHLAQETPSANELYQLLESNLANDKVVAIANWSFKLPLNLDANIFGLLFATLLYFSIIKIRLNLKKNK